MAKILQLRRRDTTSMATTLGAEGEVFYNLTTKTLHTFDGATTGGTALAVSSVAYSSAVAYANTVSSTVASVSSTVASVSSNLATTSSNLNTLSSNTWRQATSSALGLTRYATDAEAQAWSNDGIAITPNTLKTAFKSTNQSLAGNGYQKLPGGIVMAWAAGAASNAEAEQTINLPYTFTTIYTVQCSTITGAGLAPDRGYQVRSWTTNQVVVFNNAYNTGTGNGTPYVLVIGV